MKKTLLTTLAAALLIGVSASSAHASSVAVGDLIRFVNTPPAGESGRFGVYHDGDSPSNIMFWTFCLEVNEDLDGSNAFYIDNISKAARNGGVGGQDPVGSNSDPLDPRTAALFLASRTGGLNGVTGWAGATDAQRMSALQYVIWLLEDECGTGQCTPFLNASPLPLVAGLFTWLNDLSAPALTYAFNNVDVINIRYNNANGRLAQSVLYTAVPEPGSLLLLGTGLVGVARGLRRRRQATA